MQDPTLKGAQFPEQEQLKCPRCESSNTKFCYYNNYNLSQPRHFCKNCRRYWTKGGALRNIPVGGGSRKNTKRSSKHRPCSSLPQAPTAAPPLGAGPMLASGVGSPGSFTSLLGFASEGGVGQFGNMFLQGLGQSGLGLGQESGTGQDPGLKLMQETRGGSATSEGMIMGAGSGSGGDHHHHHHQMQSYWGAASNNGWPDLAIYTPGSKFQ